MIQLSQAGSAAAVEAAACALYEVSPGATPGIWQVAAACQEPAGGYTVMKIRPETPRSGWDFFALNLARARADAIVITGKILRAEPGLRYELQGPGVLPAGLAAWRREVAGLSAPPILLVLSSGRGLDLGHPALHGWARPAVFTGAAAAARLAASSGIRAVGSPAPSLLAALDWLRGRGCQRISVEAGPSTSAALYDDPPRLDELLLSVFEGPLAPALRAGALPSQARLQALLPRSAPPVSISEASGSWRFYRRLR